MDETRTGQIEAIVFRGKGGNVEYLALKRNEEKGGYWQPLTGGIHEGEDIMDALVREVDEELQLKKDDYKIVDPNYSFSFTLQSGETLQEHVFGIELQPEQAITLSSEHTKYQWLTFEKAKEIYQWDTNKKAITELNSYLNRGK